MFVSRKYLALIHFIAREVPARLDIAESAHQGIECGSPASPGSVRLQPLPKCGIQGLALGLGHKPGLVDQRFVRTQGDILKRSGSRHARRRWSRNAA
jgi:hypothetical protein